MPGRNSPEQLLLLLRLSESLAGARTVEEVANTVIDIAQHHLDAMFGGVAVVDEDNRAMAFVTLEPLPLNLQRSRMLVPLSSSRPAAVAARQRRGLFFESLASAAAGMDEESAAAAHASGGNSFVYLPMLLGSTVVGTLVLIWADETRFHSEDQQLLWALARYSAQAIDRAKLLAQRREVAHTLQAALLPVLPDIPWLDVCGHYRPASATETVGGDWYDAFFSEPAGITGPGLLTISVGDVAGHDTHAAAEMGRLVAKLRALAIDHPDDPHRLLERLERVMTANVHNRHASALVANLVPNAHATVALTWSNAGHLPPLVLRPGDEPIYLERPSDLLLGVSDPPPERAMHAIVLPPGSTIVFYTDGLVERRHEDLTAGLQRLAHSADQHRLRDLPDLVEHLVADAAIDDHDDDTVLLALRTRSTSPN